MDLNDVVSKGAPAFVFMLAVWFITLTVRHVMEKLFPSLTNKGTWWEDIILPTLPVALGMVMAIVMHKFPILSTLPTKGTRALYGIVGGAGSSLVYRIVKSIVKSKYGVDLSIPPGAIAGATVTVDVPKNDLPKIEAHYQAEGEHLPDSQKPTDPEIDAPKENTK